MNQADRFEFPIRLTLTFIGAFILILFFSNIFGYSTPGRIASSVLLILFLVIGLFLYLVAPVLFIIALIKPEKFGLEDAQQSLKRFAIIWGVGFVIVCLILYLIGTKLSLPDFDSPGQRILLFTLFPVGVVIFLSWILPWFSERSKRTQNLIWLGLGVISFTSMLTAGLIQRTLPTEMLDAAYTVCQGQALSEAEGDNQSGDVRSVIVLYEKGEDYRWESLMPLETWPEELADLALVACLGEETSDNIQTCPYVGGPSITRFQYQRPIRLVDAKTGELVASGIIKGDKPGACPQSTEKSKTSIKGPHVDKENINQWLWEYVHP